MLALGLAVDLPSPKRPALRAVLLRDSRAASEVPGLADVTLEDVFETPTMDAGDLVAQLAELSKVVTGRVRSLAPDIVVVRRADRAPRASNEAGPRIRLLATGAIVVAAYLLDVPTALRSGQECGYAYGQSKDAVDADARTLVTKPKLVEAAAAALSGLWADRVR